MFSFLILWFVRSHFYVFIILSCFLAFSHSESKCISTHAFISAFIDVSIHNVCNSEYYLLFFLYVHVTPGKYSVSEFCLRFLSLHYDFLWVLY